VVSTHGSDERGENPGRRGGGDVESQEYEQAVEELASLWREVTELRQQLKECEDAREKAEAKWATYYAEFLRLEDQLRARASQA
jgi:septal ring factor EnvC (AmiA/AmiB activator)